METREEKLYTPEDLKKAFEIGFESAVTLIEKSFVVPKAGKKSLKEFMEKKTVHTSFLRRVLFNKVFEAR